MNEALRRFKEDRPEEYQEYKGYQRKYWQISLGFYSACVTAAGVMLVSFAYLGALGGMLITFGLFGCLVWLYIKISHIRSVLKISIALLEMTFDDQIHIPLETLAELKDIFREELEENQPLVPQTIKEIQR